MQKSKYLYFLSLFVLVLSFSACGTDENDKVGNFDDLGSGDFGDVASDDMVLMDLVNGNVGDVNLVCENSVQVLDSELVAVMYFSKGKLRTEYKINPPIQGQSDLYLISDGEYMYMWGDSFLGQQMSGFKMRVTGDSVTQEEMYSFVDYDMPVVNCTEWTPVDSYFEIPADVPFMDLNELGQTGY